MLRSLLNRTLGTPMSSAVGAADFKQAAMHLEQLLIKEPYRRRWTRYERQRERRNRVHQKSVARVLTEYVDRNREDLRYRDISLKSLTQRVSKVFNGTVLSKQMLQLFIDAFEIIPRDAERLWRIYEGTDKIRVLTGPGALPPDTAAALGPVKHRTISVHKFHYLGEDGLPTRHRTRQVIQAISDGLDRYPYRFDTNALTVEVEEGGRLADPLYHVRGDIYAVDIMLE